VGADLVSCVLYTTAVALLPLRQLGFLVICSEGNEGVAYKMSSINRPILGVLTWLEHQ